MYPLSCGLRWPGVITGVIVCRLWSSSRHHTSECYNIPLPPTCPNCLPSWAHLSFGSQPFRSRIPLYCFLFFCKTDLLSVIICYLQVWPLLPAPVFGCLPPGQAALYTNTHTAIISDYRLSWLKTSVAPGQDKLSVCTHVVFAQPAGRRSESTKGKRCAKYSHDPARLRHRSRVTSGNAAPHGKVHQPCKCKVHQPCECKAGSLTTYVH